MPVTLKTMSMKYREDPNDSWSPALVQAIAPLDPVKEMLGIMIDGKRPDQQVTSGQYVIVKNSTITGITDGIYTANAALSPSTDVTAANLTAVTNGGLNSLKNSIGNLIKVVVLNIWSNESIGAGSQNYKWVSVANACPSGYKPIAITLESANIKCIANINDGVSTQPYLSEATVCVHNLDSSNAQSLDVNMIITCIKE